MTGQEIELCLDDIETLLGVLFNTAKFAQGITKCGVVKVGYEVKFSEMKRWNRMPKT
jgi:hypothetical protein